MIRRFIVLTSLLFIAFVFKVGSQDVFAQSCSGSYESTGLANCVYDSGNYTYSCGSSGTSTSSCVYSSYSGDCRAEILKNEGCDINNDIFPPTCRTHNNGDGVTSSGCTLIGAPTNTPAPTTGPGTPTNTPGIPTNTPAQGNCSGRCDFVKPYNGCSQIPGTCDNGKTCWGCNTGAPAACPYNFCNPNELGGCCLGNTAGGCATVGRYHCSEDGHCATNDSAPDANCHASLVSIDGSIPKGSGVWAASCCGGFKPTPTPTTPPLGPPSNLQKTCNAAGNQMTLTWNAGVNADYYSLRKDYTADNSWSCYNAKDTCLDTINTTTSRKMAVIPGANYKFWIHSRNNSGAWAPANGVHLDNVSCPIPAGPTNLSKTCSATSSKATFSWSPVSGISNYILRINKHDGLTPEWFNAPGDQWVCVSGTTSTRSITQGATYDDWSVQSSNAGCSARYGNTSAAGFVCPDTFAPPAPTSTLSCNYAFTGTGNNTKYYHATYSWNAVSDVGSAGMHSDPYWSQVSQYSNFWRVIALWYNNWLTSTILSRTSAMVYPEGTTVYARVRSRDANNNQSVWSSTQSLVLNSTNCNVGTATTAPIPTITSSPTPTNTPIPGAPVGTCGAYDYITRTTPIIWTWSNGYPSLQVKDNTGQWWYNGMASSPKTVIGIFTGRTASARTRIGVLFSPWGTVTCPLPVTPTPINTQTPTPTPPPTCNIQGKKVTMPGNSNQLPASTQTITFDGVDTNSNQPYFQTVIPGTHSVSTTIPPNYYVGYTTCENRTDCHSDTPTFGGTVSINCPARGYNDLWWHYYEVGTPAGGGWIKLKDASYHGVASVINFIIPNTAQPFDATDTTQAYFDIGQAGVISATGTIDFGIAPNVQSSAREWERQGYTRLHKYLNDLNSFITYARARKSVNIITDISQAQPSTINILTGDLVITQANANTLPSTSVLIVQGNITFANRPGNNHTFNPSKKSIAIISTGTMTISQSYTSLNGIFIAQGYDTGTSDQPLKIQGNMISATTVSLKRKRTDTPEKPTYFIVFDPKMYMDLLPYLSLIIREGREIK